MRGKGVDMGQETIEGSPTELPFHLFGPILTSGIDFLLILAHRRKIVVKNQQPLTNQPNQPTNHTASISLTRQNALRYHRVLAKLDEQALVKSHFLVQLGKHALIR